MKIKQLFCRHKKLTAVGIYEKPLVYNLNKTYTFASTATSIFVVCKCYRCGEEFEYRGDELQWMKNNHEKEVNIDKVFNHELWGKWW